MIPVSVSFFCLMLSGLGHDSYDVREWSASVLVSSSRDFDPVILWGYWATDPEILRRVEDVIDLRKEKAFREIESQVGRFPWIDSYFGPPEPWVAFWRARGLHGLLNQDFEFEHPVFLDYPAYREATRMTVWAWLGEGRDPANIVRTLGLMAAGDQTQRSARAGRE